MLEKWFFFALSAGLNCWGELIRVDLATASPTGITPYLIASYFQSAVDTRVLVLEVAERHDIILKLKNEVNELEEKLKQMDNHIHFKDEIIKDLRKERNILSKVQHFYVKYETAINTIFFCVCKNIH